MFESNLPMISSKKFEIEKKLHIYIIQSMKEGYS